MVSAGEITIRPGKPNGTVLPAEQVLDFLSRFPLPNQVGTGWLTLAPDYAFQLLSLLYASSAEAPALVNLFRQEVLPTLGLGSALDVGSGKGRLVELFRDFQHIELVERDPLSLRSLRNTVGALGLEAEILATDYRQLPLSADAFDLICFIHSIYYFDEDWGQVARDAFRALKPGGSLVFVVNGDEGDPAALTDYLSGLGYKGLAPLDIPAFIKACTQIDEAAVRVFRLPLRIPAQHHPDFLTHMARVFLEDHSIAINTDDARAYLQTRPFGLGFVDKIIVLTR